MGIPAPMMVPIPRFTTTLPVTIVNANLTPSSSSLDLRMVMGAWRDQHGNRYLLSKASRGSRNLDVTTTRPDGHVIHTKGLIKVCDGYLAWGCNPTSHKFQNATFENITSNRIHWNCAGMKLYEWTRDLGSVQPQSPRP